MKFSKRIITQLIIVLLYVVPFMYGAEGFISKASSNSFTDILILITGVCLYFISISIIVFFIIDMLKGNKI